MERDRRQEAIGELARAIGALARGDDAEAGTIIKALASGFTGQATLPGMPAPAAAPNAGAARVATARDLFAYWQRECEHTHAKLTPERSTSIIARLKDGYSAAEIRKAIDGAKHSAFEKDGKRFDDITLICRNGSKLEDFIERGTRATGAIVVQAPTNGGIEDQIAAKRRLMATLKREGRTTEYNDASHDLHKLLARREVQPASLRSPT